MLAGRTLGEVMLPDSRSLNRELVRTDCKSASLQKLGVDAPVITLLAVLLRMMRSLSMKMRQSASEFSVAPAAARA